MDILTQTERWRKAHADDQSMSGERGGRVDVIVGDEGAGQSGAHRGGGVQGRPSLQVWFECAAAYQRVFRSVDGKRYTARCPKCGKSMQFAVGESGTSQRLFRLSC